MGQAPVCEFVRDGHGGFSLLRGSFAAFASQMELQETVNLLGHRVSKTVGAKKGDALDGTYKGLYINCPKAVAVKDNVEFSYLSSSTVL